MDVEETERCTSNRECTYSLIIIFDNCPVKKRFMKLHFLEEIYGIHKVKRFGLKGLDASYETNVQMP